MPGSAPDSAAFPFPPDASAAPVTVSKQLMVGMLCEMDSRKSWLEDGHPRAGVHFSLTGSRSYRTEAKQNTGPLSLATREEG